MSQSTYQIFQTSIVRANDGLILCEYTTEGALIPVEVSQSCKRFIKNEKLFKQNVEFSLVEFGAFTIGFQVQDGVLFLALVNSSYDVKLCKQYVLDIQTSFQEELRSTYGTSGAINYYSKIQTIEGPYAFIKFDRYVKRKCKEFSDQRSQANIDRIKNDMTDINQIMHQVYSKVMDRGKAIEEMGHQATQLKDDLKKVSSRSRDLEWNMWMKKNAVYFILVSLFLLFILFKII